MTYKFATYKVYLKINVPFNQTHSLRWNVKHVMHEEKEKSMKISLMNINILHTISNQAVILTSFSFK